MPDAASSRPPRIAIGTPSTGHWRESMGVCAVGLAAMTSCAGAIVDCIGATGAYTEVNRNNIVEAALQREFDAILWIDSDMKFPPDALVHLINRNLDIVGATYRERQEPYRFLGSFLDGDDRHAAESGLHRMARLPGGFILVRTAVYRAITAPWYRLDELGYRDDYYFSNLARAAGFEVWCDMDLTRHIVHRGEQDVGWFEDGEVAARRSDDPRWAIFEKPPRTGGAVPGGGLAAAAQETVP